MSCILKWLSLFVVLGFAAGCKSSSVLTTEPTPIRPAPSSLRAEVFAEIDSAVESAVAQGLLPGGVFWLERGKSRHVGVYGSRALLPEREPMSINTIFDAASLTKVMATAPAILLLHEKGLLELEDPVRRHLPEFAGGNRDLITIRHLLTHTSGMRPGLSSTPAWNGSVKAIELACREKPESTPGSQFRYSDINYILLGELVHRISGKPLNEFVKWELYQPLRMRHTQFIPDSSLVNQMAPTEKVEGQFLRGVVHDPTARRMGGVAGHAGLFTTVDDAARFCRMIINEGELDGIRVFKPETVRKMISVNTDSGVPVRRGLGWDIDSPYSRPRGGFPLGSFGHTGFTGTSIWIDPFSKTFWIFLSNRVHPNGKGFISELQARLGELSSKAVHDFDFAAVPGALRPIKPAAAIAAAKVRNGIDVLVDEKFAPLQGLKIGLITNHTGRDQAGRPTIDLLFNAPGVQLKALFSPEHGIRGDLDGQVSDETDRKTGLPIYSLYGTSRQPSASQLQGLDALVFDIQDIGCRFYTYISTLGNCMEAASKNKLRFFILDRVNPINGAFVEGPIHQGKSEFIAYHSLPVRHGMTVGELGLMFNEEKGFGLPLEVIKIQGWKRDWWFDQTGLPWQNTSPNIRNLSAAILYPGIGVLEFSNLSVGRGTPKPFELLGAPFIDGTRLAQEIQRRQIPGVLVSAAEFTPTSSVYKGEKCKGISMTLTDRNQFDSLSLGLAIAEVLYRMYPDTFQLEKVEKLLKHPGFIAGVREGKSAHELQKTWAPDLQEFKARRKKFLLYP